MIRAYIALSALAALVWGVAAWRQGGPTPADGWRGYAHGAVTAAALWPLIAVMVVIRR